MIVFCVILIAIIGLLGYLFYYQLNETISLRKKLYKEKENNVYKWLGTKFQIGDKVWEKNGFIFKPYTVKGFVIDGFSEGRPVIRCLLREFLSQVDIEKGIGYNDNIILPFQELATQQEKNEISIKFLKKQIENLENEQKDE